MIAGALATMTMNTPGPTEWARRYSSAIRCLRSPAVQSITGDALSAAQARTRRANRPARRIRSALSSTASASASLPPIRRRHQVRTARRVPHRIVRIEHDPVT